MKGFRILGTVVLPLAVATCAGLADRRGDAAREDLWGLARKEASVHRFSTLFTAQDVRRYLGTEDGLTSAIAWCRMTGVTKVYLEVFRDSYTAEKETLERARDRFRREGFIAHGCVTTTRVGKTSTGWNVISCYTDRETQARLDKIFRYAASLFDVVMIDDFWFTDCACEECTQARGDRSWSAYRSDLMNRVSRERVIEPARAVNPNVKLIIKYPEWYDRFHERGYDVVGETALFDVTWIGTETRDPDNPRWGKKPQFGAYWLSLWTRAFSGGKLGGGWFDPLGTTPRTYVEQARQTILGLCRESMLFCYGALHRNHGPADVAALRRELPGLLELAAFVDGETPRGVGTYRPPGTPAGEDMYIFNFIGMLGIPMTADVRFPADAPSLFLTTHALADPNLERSLAAVIDQGRPILMTSGLRAGLSEPLRARLSAPGVHVIELGGASERSFYGVLDSVRALMSESRERVDARRRPLLAPLGVEFSAPPLVSLYLFGARKVVIENFNDHAVDVRLAIRDRTDYGVAVVLPPGAEADLRSNKDAAEISLPARSLVALRMR